jgi:hypothetical protein
MHRFDIHDTKSYFMPSEVHKTPLRYDMARAADISRWLDRLASLLPIRSLSPASLPLAVMVKLLIESIITGLGMLIESIIKLHICTGIR